MQHTTSLIYHGGSIVGGDWLQKHLHEMDRSPSTLGPTCQDMVPNFPQCEPRRLKVIHVGMGASGLLFAYKAKELKNLELVCYERNDTVGGTWYENRYPGCACDIPAQTYTYPFYPNTEWSGYYSYSNEIQAYFLRFAKEYDLERFASFGTTVLSGEWNDCAGKWNLSLRRKDGSIFTDTCDVLVNGSGIFNKWKWPDIEGLSDYKGVLAHSANWPDGVDWKGKRVAVIGTGSSSIQMVPKFAETAAHVTVIMRNKTYIGPQIGSSISNTEADPDAMDPQAAGKHSYTEREKQKFRDDPGFHLQYRRKIEAAVVSGFRIFYRGSEANLEARRELQAAMAQKLGDHAELKARLIPDWSPGCRRLTPGEGYLESLVRDNVTPVFDDIVKITSHGFVTADGKDHQADILACATGFDIQYLPHFRLVGRGGKVMQDGPPNVYASIAVPDFPNYFVVNGPRGNWGQGCALPSHEVQIDYIIQCCRKMQEDRIRSMVPKANVTEQINAFMDAWHKKHSVWAEACRSWYKDNKPDGRVYIWPGSLLHHLKYLKRPRYEHFDITYEDPDNMFAFLGNGLTLTEEKASGGDLPVPYIRNHESDAWEIE